MHRTAIFTIVQLSCLYVGFRFITAVQEIAAGKILGNDVRR